MLSGNLRTMGLPEILQWISAGRKMGTLELQRGSIHKKILFREGNIHSSWSNDPRESLGQFLIRSRQVTEEQLFKALLRQETQGKLLGTILIDDGLLGEPELKKLLRAKAEESIFDIFLWPEGQFEFKDGVLSQDLSVHLDTPVTAVILEGIRRVDEWARIREVFSGIQTTFDVKRGKEAKDDTEREALALAAAGKTLAQMSLEMRRSEFETAALLFDLHSRGFVTVAKFEREAPPTEALETLQELLAEAEIHLRERRYEQAVSTYERVLALDRLNQNAKKGLLLVSEQRAKARAARLVPRHVVPFLTVDFITLTQQNFDPLEGFVLSRVNNQWDVQSILKLCPIAEDDALAIFARLLERGVIELREP